MWSSEPWELEEDLLSEKRETPDVCSASSTSTFLCWFVSPHSAARQQKSRCRLISTTEGRQTCQSPPREQAGASRDHCCSYSQNNSSIPAWNQSEQVNHHGEDQQPDLFTDQTFPHQQNQHRGYSGHKLNRCSSS